MKSLEQILDTYESKTLDGRDLNRFKQIDTIYSRTTISWLWYTT